MKVLDVRRRLGDKLREAALGRDVDAVASALDYGRAILLALMPLADDEEAELPDLTVTTATAARILSLHVEYVRELIRRNVLPGTKHNNEYEIRLIDVMDFMGSSRFGGAWPVRPKTAVAMFGPIWRWPRADVHPGQEPGTTTQSP